MHDFFSTTIFELLFYNYLSFSTSNGPNKMTASLKDTGEKALFKIDRSELNGSIEQDVENNSKSLLLDIVNSWVTYLWYLLCWKGLDFISSTLGRRLNSYLPKKHNICEKNLKEITNDKDSIKTSPKRTLFPKSVVYEGKLMLGSSVPCATGPEFDLFNDGISMNELAWGTQDMDDMRYLMRGNEKDDYVVSGMNGINWNLPMSMNVSMNMNSNSLSQVYTFGIEGPYTPMTKPGNINDKILMDNNMGHQRFGGEFEGMFPSNLQLGINDDSSYNRNIDLMSVTQPPSLHSSEVGGIPVNSNLNELKYTLESEDTKSYSRKDSDLLFSEQYSDDDVKSSVFGTFEEIENILSSTSNVFPINYEETLLPTNCTNNNSTIHSEGQRPRSQTQIQVQPTLRSQPSYPDINCISYESPNNYPRVQRIQSSDSVLDKGSSSSSSPSIDRSRSYSHDLSYDDGSHSLDMDDESLSGKMFKCPGCTATFRVKGYLTRHMKKHDKIKAFHCPYYDINDSMPCHQTGEFCRRDTYKTHLKALHFVYPPGTKSIDRKLVGGKCASCLKHFESNEVWILEHLEKGICPGMKRAATKMRRRRGIKKRNPIQINLIEIKNINTNKNVDVDVDVDNGNENEKSVSVKS